MELENTPITCFIQKWNQSIHGIGDDEMEYLKFLETKMIVLNINNLDETNSEYIDELLNIIDSHSHINFRNSEIAIAKRFYLYRDRTFVIKHNGIEKFKKLWKNYHTNYILPRKQLKNIFKREIYGKFII